MSFTFIHMSKHFNLPVSAILITKNEERNIRPCLDSLTWISEIIIVDSGSEDATCNIAQSYENVTLIESEWLGYSETKRLATQYTNQPWIFWIDADEVVTKELQEEIQALFTQATIPHQGYDIPRKTFFMGEWVQHTGWYPGRVLRLFHKEKGDFNQKILHEGVELYEEATLGHLKADLLHYSYTSLYQYFDKMAGYGKYGALELEQRGKKWQPSKLILSPLAMFFKLYFLNKGFMDGKKGLIISVGSAFSQFIKYVNFYYLKKYGKVEDF